MGIQERKEREKEQRRDEIINAAQKIFFEKGLQAATMDEIALAAELSKGTIYLYYKSKEDLYVAVVLRGEERMYEMFQSAVSGEKPVIQKIADLGDAYLEFYKQNIDYFRMLIFYDTFKEHKQVSEDMLSQCKATDQRVWSLVIGTIQQGINEGVLRSDLNAMQAGVMLWSNSNGFMRLMDRQDAYWKQMMPLDLEETLRLSNSFLVQSMMTPESKEQYHTLFERRTVQAAQHN